MKDKAIIFDLDGTAVDSPAQKLPTSELISTVQLLKDAYFLSCATGRVWTFAEPVLKMLKLTDPCIISAGTQICDPQTGDILWQKTIDDDSLKQVLEIFTHFPRYKLLYNDYAEDDYFRGGYFPKEIQINEPVYFLEQVFVPNQVAAQLLNELKRIKNIACVRVVSQKPECSDLHIVHSGATKQHAIAELLSMLGVDKEHCIGIGDGHNDLHLFEAVGYKVAMGNAVSELKKDADEIIGSVKEDGLTDYMKSLIVA